MVQELEHKYNEKKEKEKGKEGILMGCGCNKLCPKCRKNKNNCTCKK